jgi:hypothetical protein
MKRVSSGVAVVLLVACSSKGPPGNAPIDAPRYGTEDPSWLDTCNPVSQTGCSPDQKCTWDRVAAGAGSPIGEIACVPAGTKQLGQACRFGAAGAVTGYDDCASGLICDAPVDLDGTTGVCAAICDSSALAGEAGACATGFACDLREHVFLNSGEPPNLIGMCDHTCDPLTDVRDSDGAAGCGGVITNGVSGYGCYGLPDPDLRPTHFTCEKTIDPSKKSDAYAYDAALGVQANSCATGYEPLLYDDTADSVALDQTKIICVALCAPAPTSLESHPNPGGVSPHACADAGATGAHECRYWWFVEQFADGNTALGSWSNTLGFCMDPTRYTFDGSLLHPPRSNAEWPSCASLSSTAMTYDADPGGTQTVPDDVYWGCAPEPTTLRSRARSPVRAATGRPPTR